MPKMAVEVPHSLGLEEALKRVNDFLPKVREHFKGQVSNLEESWVGNVLNYSFSTFGFGVKGKMAVEENAVKIDQDLPFAAMMFKGKIEESLRKELQNLLA